MTALEHWRGAGVGLLLGMGAAITIAAGVLLFAVLMSFFRRFGQGDRAELYAILVLYLLLFAVIGWLAGGPPP